MTKQMTLNHVLTWVRTCTYEWERLLRRPKGSFDGSFLVGVIGDEFSVEKIEVYSLISSSQV